MKSWGIWCVVAVLFCSPLNIGWLHQVPMLHFDHEGMLWLIGLNEYLQGSEIMISGWPNGQSNVQLDSILLLWMAYILQAQHYPELFTYLIAIVGLSLSAWSAQRLSRHLFPDAQQWSWTAGCLFGFQALSTVSILEGHIYLLWIFWLPLGWLSLLHLTRENTIQHVSCVIGCWMGAVLTSAYVGLCLTLLYLIYGIWNWRQRHRGLLMSGGTIIGLGLFYSWRILNTSTRNRRTVSDEGVTSLLEEIQFGSSALSNWTTWTPDTDLFQHSLGPTFGWLPLLILLSAPWLLQRTQSAFALTLSVTALLFSMGPYIALSPDQWLLPSPLYPFYNSIVGHYCHFPVRFMYLSVLGIAILMPLLLQQFEKRCSNRVWFLAFACVFEPFLINGLPLRQGSTPVQYPSIYEQTPSGLAVLDLVPRLANVHLVEPLRIKNKICSYQVKHTRTLINECLGKHPTGPFEEHLREEMLLPSIQRMWQEPLMGLGVGAVVLHADLWPPSKRNTVVTHLSQSLGSPIEQVDGGEHLIMWTLSTTPNDINIPLTLKQMGLESSSNK